MLDKLYLQGNIRLKEDKKEKYEIYKTISRRRIHYLTHIKEFYITIKNL